MTMVNIEIKVRQSRIVDNYLIRHTALGEVPPIPPITQIDSYGESSKQALAQLVFDELSKSIADKLMREFYKL